MAFLLAGDDKIYRLLGNVNVHEGINNVYKFDKRINNVYK